MESDSFDLTKLASLLGAKLDAKTKFTLLDMIDPRPVEVVDTYDPFVNAFSEEKLRDLCQDKLDCLICDNIFQSAEQMDFLLKCRDEAEQVASQGQMKEAGFGRGQEYTKDKKVRGDLFIWLSSLTKENLKANQGQEDLERLSNIKELVNSFNRIKDQANEYLNKEQEFLDDREIQLALYPGTSGEYYLRHKDAFRLDVNNVRIGQKLRKLTTIVYLNPDLDAIKQDKSKKVGELRVYLKDKIIDVVPRMGRVIIFKSERVEHEVKPTLGYRRFAIATWFHHTVRQEQIDSLAGVKTIKDQDQEEMKESQKQKENDDIFIGIPAYRDPELPLTMDNVIRNADEPKRLHFGVCFQYDSNGPDNETDLKIKTHLQAIIDKYKDLCHFSIDYLDFKEARNAYYARHRVQKLYGNQHYYLQLDSHIRLVKHWDTLLKSYLDQCINPQKSIITVYPRSYKKGQSDEEILPKSEDALQGPLAMCLKEFSQVDDLPRYKSRIIKRADKFQKPFRSLFWAGGFGFSLGQLIRDCPYTDEVDDVFFGEELFQMQKFFHQGYQMYSPPTTLAYHLWERDYRKTYKEDHKADEQRQKNQQRCLAQIKKVITSDAAFLEEMKTQRGVDLVNKTFNELAEYGGIDPSFL